MGRPAWRHPHWFKRPANRIRFLQVLRLDWPGARIAAPRREFRGGFAVQTRIEPVGVGQRTVDIVFPRWQPEEPKVFVDGPADSPHRYRDGSLCIWFPYDPPEARWHRPDGPTALLGHVAAHLIKEEHHRRTGEWPGAEALH
ncbi:hypothetical protein LO763_09995 [Glycomyces sp. A-F 0318]|uniref:hypothetical protein n=1 Tax=Glycomyces amatae TaxID=2881355 RepID=UPI001E3A4CE4|nr:hypothetical protein [Glycomyces amatae]MCD0443954.1 hypothetical protein [Glycomyces amatae]